MYQIIIDNHDGERFILHDSRSNNIRVISAQCEMELNKTGTLTFSISPTHPNFDKIYKHKSEIYLFQDDDCIFCGRILNDETDIYNFKNITCEGMLAYLLDSIQRAKLYSITGSNKITEYLTDILEIHNSQVDDHKKFSVGLISEVDQSDTFYKISSYDDTLTTLNKDLVETFNHTYLSADFKNGKKVINYVNSDQLPVNNQSIVFGKNLLSLNRTIKGEEIATAIIPLGGSAGSEETENGTVDYKLTISSISDGQIKDNIYKKDDYVYDKEAVEKYGWIFKAISYDGVDNDVNNLLNSGVEQLNYYSKLASTIELTAFDLHLLNVNVDSFRVGQKVRVYSKAHNLDDYLIVQKISIDLDRPDNTTITLGDEERVSIDVNSSSSKKTTEVNDKIDELEKNLTDNYNDKDYFNSDDFNNKIRDVNNDYFGSDDFNSDMDKFFNDQYGSGGLTDLSKYALIEDVQNSFDELADLLKGV